MHVGVFSRLWCFNDCFVKAASNYKAYPIRTSYVCLGMSDSLRQELKPYQVREQFRKNGSNHHKPCMSQSASYTRGSLQLHAKGYNLKPLWLYVCAQVSVSVVEPGVVKTPFHDLSHSTVGSRLPNPPSSPHSTIASKEDRPTLAYPCVVVHRVASSSEPLFFAFRAWRW